MQRLRPPQTSRKEQRQRPAGVYPAGRVIAVVVLALLFAALLDADSLVASVSSERYGTARSVELSLVRPFKDVSDALRLNLPHRWLASIGGTNQPGSGGAASVAVPPRGGVPEGVPALLGGIDALLRPKPAGPGSRRTAPAAGGVSHVAAKGPPRPLRPTAAAPLKIWVAGDSLIGMLADAVIGHVAGDRAVRATEDMQIGTGLARPDVYNWPAAIAAEIRDHDPSVVIVTFGANDDQDMQAGGRYYVRDSAAWKAEYARRVSAVMNEVATAGRLLVWVLVPPVASPHLEYTTGIINHIVSAEAATHPGVAVVDPGPAIAPHGFAEYLDGPGGHPVQVRDADGVHLTSAGADRVLPLVLAAIRTRWLLR